MQEEIGIAVVLLLIAACAYGAMCAATQTQEISIDKMWTKSSPNDDKSQIYLVSDIDGNVYCVKDTTVFWKFDASDRWAKLDEGETYVVTTVGWRVSFVSMYPNIIEIEEA